MSGWQTQSGSGVRFEWGPAGAARLAKEAACLVVVDVLSFTTAVSIAVEKDIRVLPFWWPASGASDTEHAGAAMAAEAYARQSGGRQRPPPRGEPPPPPTGPPPPPPPA
ncbi:2-phosphosulfolactate phosphatase, partial [Streptomyces sp. NPDC002143]